MTNYRKRTSRRFISILVAACLLLSLGIAAYATGFFGIQALLIENNNPTPEGFEAGGYLSVTQPQDVPEEIDNSINEKISNSTKAWAEWDSWRKTNGIFQPDVFVSPSKATGILECDENEDGTYTLIFKKAVRVYDEEGNVIDVTYEEEERRIATAEEYEQDRAYMEALSKGFPGYDYNYYALNQEMADKLEEIATSYGLKLRHEQTVMYENFGSFTEFNTFEEVNEKVNEICAGGNNFFRTAPTGFEKFYYFDEGTFAVSFFTTDDRTNIGTSCYLYNSPYGTLSSGYEIVSLVRDIGAMSTYTHTAPDGTEITVLHNGADMFAYVYLENSFVTMQFHQITGLSPEEINSIIDMVNFSAIG